MRFFQGAYDYKKKPSWGFFAIRLEGLEGSLY